MASKPTTLEDFFGRIWASRQTQVFFASRRYTWRSIPAAHAIPSMARTQRSGPRPFVDTFPSATTSSYRAVLVVIQALPHSPSDTIANSGTVQKVMLTVVHLVSPASAQSFPVQKL